MAITTGRPDKAPTEGGSGAAVAEAAEHAADYRKRRAGTRIDSALAMALPGVAVSGTTALAARLLFT